MFQKNSFRSSAFKEKRQIEGFTPGNRNSYFSGFSFVFRKNPQILVEHLLQRPGAHPRGFGVCSPVGSCPRPDYCAAGKGLSIFPPISVFRGAGHTPFFPSSESTKWRGVPCVPRADGCGIIFLRGYPKFSSGPPDQLRVSFHGGKAIS